eukprot:s786_g5.t1
MLDPCEFFRGGILNSCPLRREHPEHPDPAPGGRGNHQFERRRDAVAFPAACVMAQLRIPPKASRTSSTNLTRRISEPAGSALNIQTNKESVHADAHSAGEAAPNGHRHTLVASCKLPKSAMEVEPFFVAGAVDKALAFAALPGKEAAEDVTQVGFEELLKREPALLPDLQRCAVALIQKRRKRAASSQSTVHIPSAVTAAAFQPEASTRQKRMAVVPTELNPIPVNATPLDIADVFREEADWSELGAFTSPADEDVSFRIRALLAQVHVTRRAGWQQFLAKRQAWPRRTWELRQGASLPQGQVPPLLNPLRPRVGLRVPRSCWDGQWFPQDCCFFQPMDVALSICFSNATDLFMACCPWETVEEMQASLISCELSPARGAWRAVQAAFEECVGKADELDCMRTNVAPRFPTLPSDPFCSMGVALRGLFLSSHKPFEPYDDSNAILPDAGVQGFDECMLHGADQAECCLRVRHCKCTTHPADATGCNLGVSIECATCLILIPTLILKDSGWRGIFAYTLRYLQQLSIDRLGLVLPRLPVDLLWRATAGRAGERHAALISMGNRSGALGWRLVQAAVEDFFTQSAPYLTVADLWASAVETGVLTVLADFLGDRHVTVAGQRIPLARLYAIDDLIPTDLRYVIPKQFRLTYSSREKFNKELKGPYRKERESGGLLEAAWLQALRAWPHRCCPPDAVGALTILHPPPAGGSKWPVLLLAMCLACESNNLQLLLQVQRSLSCLGRTCAVMPKGQIEELHADQLWRDPAARRWLPFLQLTLQRFVGPIVPKWKAKDQRVLSTEETMSFLKAGGSTARFGDGEYWAMDRGFIAPMQRNRLLMESLTYVARLGSTGCPQFKVAMVDVLGSSGFPDSTHFEWWKTTPWFREVPFRFFPPGLYGNMWVNYKPPDESRQPDFIQGWEQVFNNKSVLLIGHPFAQLATGGHASGVMFSAKSPDATFPARAAQVSYEMMREVATRRLPPFSSARSVRLLRRNTLTLGSTVRWLHVLESIRAIVDESDVDVVAVSWGPQGKALVADIACRGVQALDVGRLLFELHGHLGMSMVEELSRRGKMLQRRGFGVSINTAYCAADISGSPLGMRARAHAPPAVVLPEDLAPEAAADDAAGCPSPWSASRAISGLRDSSKCKTMAAPVPAHRCAGSAVHNYYLVGSVLYLIGSVFYTLASLVTEYANLGHAGNFCFVLGSVLFVADAAGVRQCKPAAHQKADAVQAPQV